MEDDIQILDDIKRMLLKARNRCTDLHIYAAPLYSQISAAETLVEFLARSCDESQRHIDEREHWCDDCAYLEGKSHD